MRPRLSPLWRKIYLFSSPTTVVSIFPLNWCSVSLWPGRSIRAWQPGWGGPGEGPDQSLAVAAMCHHASAVWLMARRKGGHNSRPCMHAAKKIPRGIFKAPHSSRLLTVATVINPSLLPWATAGRTVISLCSKAADFTLVFIIHHFGQVFRKGWVIVELIGMDGVTPQAST